MAVAVSTYKPAQSPIEGIANALKVVETVYGIKGASAKADQLQQEMALKSQAGQREQTTFDQSQKDYADTKDADSEVSRSARTALGDFVKLASATKFGSKNQGLLSGLADLASESESPNNPTPLASKHEIDAAVSSPAFKGLESAINKEIGADGSMDRFAAMLGARTELGNKRLGVSVNKDYKSTMGPIEGTIQAANGVQEIIGKLINADPNDPNSIKTTKLLRAELNNKVGSLFNQGKAATVSGAHDAAQDTAFGSLADTYTKLTGNPTDTIPTEILKQMSNDVTALRASASENHNVQYQSFREGLDDSLRGNLDNRFKKFRVLSGLDPASKEDSSAGVGFPGASSAYASGQMPNPQLSGGNVIRQKPSESDQAAAIKALAARRAAKAK